MKRSKIDKKLAILSDVLTAFILLSGYFFALVFFGFLNGWIALIMYYLCFSLSIPFIRARFERRSRENAKKLQNKSERATN